MNRINEIKTYVKGTRHETSDFPIKIRRVSISLHSRALRYRNPLQVRPL
jgi:hypothetical protein